MKHLFSALTILILTLSLTSCGQVQLDKLSGKLSVSYCNSDVANWDNARAEAFAVKFPEIELNVNVEHDSAAYVQNTSKALASGTADDIIAYDFISYTMPADPTLLVDFKELMQNDSKFVIDDYYENALSALEYAGGLYAFPTAFYYRIAGISKEAPAAMVDFYKKRQTINYDDMLGLLKQYYIGGSVYLDVGFSPANYVLRNLSHYISVNSINRTCDFYSQDFVNNLAEAVKYTPPQNISFVGFKQEGFYDNYTQAALGKKNIFLEATNFNCELYLPTTDSTFEHFIPIVRRNGKLEMFPQEAFAISSKSKNRMLAWEFIKFMTDGEGYVTDNETYPSIPINKKAFEKQYSKRLYDAIQKLQDLGLYADSGNRQQDIDNAIAKISANNSLPMEYIELYKYFDVVGKALTPYLSGKTTVTGAAEQLQTDVSAMLEMSK